LFSVENIREQMFFYKKCFAKIISNLDQNSLHASVSIPVDAKMSSFFFPLPDYHLILSKCSYSWCLVSLFGISMCCLCSSSN